jgi:hypothetical protein
MVINYGLGDDMTYYWFYSHFIYIYPLVMTNIAMERFTMFKNGKPSISIRTIYTMAIIGFDPSPQKIKTER